MNVSIIAIGDELLIGQVTDTNTGEIARMIAPLGWQLTYVQIVRDDADEIREAIARALGRADIVLTTGGLGPTKDDITKQVMCEYFGGELRHDPAVYENIRMIFARRGLTLNDLTKSQAMVPTSCRVIQNAVGTAPVMWFDHDGKVLVSMPGVPFEMRHAMTTEVLPQLQARFGVGETIEHRVILLTNISESAAAEALDSVERDMPDHLHLAYLPQPGLVRLRLDGKHADADMLTADIDRYADIIADTLHDYVIWRHDDSPAEIVLQLMRQRGLHLATAESCTGGNIAHTLTAVAGCSDVYNGSVVSYTNTAKSELLGVQHDIIDRHGAVSIEVVTAMAEGAAHALHADCAIATSGIAGPGGGSPDKPVGTVCIAITTPCGTHAERFAFPGSRDRVIDRATRTALLMLARKLLDEC